MDTDWRLRQDAERGDTEDGASGIFRLSVSMKKEVLFVVLSGIVMGLSWIFLYEAYVRIGVGLMLVSLPGVFGHGSVDGFGLLCGFASAAFHVLMVIFTMKAPHITGVKNSMIQLAVSWVTVALFLLAGKNVSLPDSPEQWFWVLLHETLSLPEIVGAVLILGGAVVTTVNDQRVEKTEENM